MNDFFDNKFYETYIKSRNLGDVLFYYLSGNANLDDKFFDTINNMDLSDSQRELMINLGNILFSYFNGKKLSENEIAIIATLSNDEKMYAMLAAAQFNIKMGKTDFIDSCLVDVGHLSNEELTKIINSPSSNDKKISAMQISAECNLKAKKRNYKIFCQNVASISLLLVESNKQKKKVK